MPQKATSTVPIRCIEQRPTPQTVVFAGVHINLTRIAESYAPPIDKGYLSKIFSRKQTPSLDIAEKIAEALGMDLQAFVSALKGE